VLVDRLADPLSVWVASDGLVHCVNQNDLKVLVSGVFSDPVAVENTEASAAASATLLGGRLERLLVLELVDSLVGWLAVAGTLGHGALATSTAKTHTVDNVALLGAVSKTASLVGAHGLGGAVDGRQLTQLPCPDAGQEPHHVTLLLPPYFLHVLVGPHGYTKCSVDGPKQHKQKIQDIMLIHTS